ncbi:hypothetical protein SNE40_006596 [Patella caerulea]|uniref:Temptin Cys/Cys disulfide domain-containing protein n=1 Tax=Patella caerulea TaxID=87958 RepID=A0AAN8JXW5_PATCE
MLRVVILAVCLSSMVYCKPKYMDELPNGHNIPNPCKPGETWPASGHNDPTDGDSDINQFGEDFKHHHKEWNKELCMLDSDRDGKTNGAELGDPSCIWTHKGSHNLPAPTGHPGICEPVGSPACSFQGFSCAGGFSGKHHHGRDYQSD